MVDMDIFARPWFRNICITSLSLKTWRLGYFFGKLAGHLLRIETSL